MASEREEEEKLELISLVGVLYFDEREVNSWMKKKCLEKRTWCLAGSRTRSNLEVVIRLRYC